MATELLYLPPFNPLRFYVLAPILGESIKPFPVMTPPTAPFGKGEFNNDFNNDFAIELQLSQFPFIREQEYTQKFAQKDNIFIQIIYDDDNARNFELFLCDAKGNILVTPTITTDIRVAGVLSWQTWNIKLTNFQKGHYIIVIRDNYNYNATHYASNLFCVNAENEKLPLIQYRNTNARGDVWYANNHVDIFSIRVEGGFQEKNQNIKMNNVIYMGGDYKYRVLNSLVYKIRIFTAGDTEGIDDDFHFTIANAMTADTLFIDGRGYQLTDGAEWTTREIEYYHLRSHDIELAPTGTALDRENLPAPFSVPQLMHPANYLYNQNNIIMI